MELRLGNDVRVGLCLLVWNRFSLSVTADRLRANEPLFGPWRTLYVYNLRAFFSEFPGGSNAEGDADFKSKQDPTYASSVSLSPSVTQLSDNSCSEQYSNNQRKPFL